MRDAPVVRIPIKGPLLWDWDQPDDLLILESDLRAADWVPASEVKAVKDFLAHELMPRYVELFEEAGLGAAGESQVVQAAIELLEGHPVPKALSDTGVNQ
jgi:hypothetical protein